MNNQNDNYPDNENQEHIENNQNNMQQHEEQDREQYESSYSNDDNETRHDTYQQAYQEQNGLNAPKKTKRVNQQNQKSGRGGHFLSSIFGGLVSAVLIVGLLLSGVIPIENFTSDQADNTSQKQTSNQDSNDATRAIKLDNADEATNIDEVSEAVVGVKNLQKQDMWDPGEEAGSGSGIIYKKENGKAYVVTNNHVVNNAKEVEVVLSDDEQVKATVLGKDELTDLAVLEIDGDKVDVVASLGSSEDLTVGETVLAIGNPLGQEFYGSVTRGIVSGLNRSIEVDTNGDRQPDWITEVIQTDTAINPGNSGGALVNTDGEVIGINSMKVARDAVEGIGFAIPIDSAVPIMEQLESDGEITRPYIGISTAAIEQVPMQYREQIQLPDDIDGGMVVANAEPESPAGKAGLQQFDVITKINGEEITSTLDLRKFLYNETKIGDSVNVEFYRDGKQQEVELKLAERDI